MSDIDSDSEVQFNTGLNRHSRAYHPDDGQDESVNERNHESQSETENDKEEQSSVINDEVGVPSPQQPTEIHASQSESSDNMPRCPSARRDIIMTQPDQQRHRPSCSPMHNLGEPERSRRCNRFVDNPDQHSRTIHPRADNPGRHSRQTRSDVAHPEQQNRYPDISVRNPDRRPDEPCHYVSDTDGYFRPPYRYDSSPYRFSEGQDRYNGPKRTNTANRRTKSFSHGRYSPRRRARSPSPHYHRTLRHSRHRSRRPRSPLRPYYSPYRQHYSSPSRFQMRSPGRGDMNQSNRQSRHIPRGRPDYKENPVSRPRPHPDPYDSDSGDASSDGEHHSPRLGGFEDDQVHYSSRYHGMPRIKPEPYTGNEDWEEYQSHFEDCAELSRWDHRSKVLFLAASLKGLARTYYMSLDTHDKRSYSALVNKMKQRFGSSRHAIKWLNQLELRQRKPGESITALGDELRQLAKKAYRKLDSNAQETLALNQLYKLIPVDMKCRCIDHDCQSVQQAVEVIERYEAILGEAGQERKRNNVRAIDMKTEAQNADSSVSNILKKLDARLEKLESLQLTQKIAGPGNPHWRPSTGSKSKCCFHCSSPDHLIKSCPIRIRQGPKPRYQGQNNVNTQGNRVPLNEAFQATPGTVPPQVQFQQKPQQQHPGYVPNFSVPPPSVPENGQLSAQ